MKQPARRGVINALAWLGLALLTASFIVLVLEQPRRMPTSAVPQRPSEPFAVVVIDPGHGGADSGAMAGNILEKDLTLDIAHRVERLLSQHGVATLMTRVGDSYVALADRAALANRAEDAVFVSIHCNDGSRALASGVETYFAAEQSTPRARLASWLPFLQPVSQPEPNVESQSLAAFIQQALVGQTHAIDRGTKAEQFYVLANVRHPAVLVEAGFLTNRDEANKLSDVNYREEIAQAISSGVLKYRDALRADQSVQHAE